MLKPAAAAAGLAVYQAVNVRLAPNRIPIPDLVIVEPVDRDAVVVDAASVRLVWAAVLALRTQRCVSRSRQGPRLTSPRWARLGCVLDEIRILRGSPTDEELAALVAVLVSRSTPATTGGSVPVSWWAQSARPAAALRGAGAWRVSALPR
jgi:hypothetical protein